MFSTEDLKIVLGKIHMMMFEGSTNDEIIKSFVSTSKADLNKLDDSGKATVEYFKTLVEYERKEYNKKVM
jgi:hypothetical protein